MKFVALLIVVLAVYLYWARESPVAPTVEKVTGSEAAALSSGPKAPVAAAEKSGMARPIHRTNEVLSTVKSRNGEGEF